MINLQIYNKTRARYIYTDIHVDQKMDSYGNTRRIEYNI